MASILRRAKRLDVAPYLVLPLAPMHEYYVIKKTLAARLAAAGLREEVADVELDVYGSMHSIFASAVARVMIGWDGEEGFGYVEVWEGENAWRVLRAVVPEGPEDQFAADLETLAEELARHLRAARPV